MPQFRFTGLLRTRRFVILAGLVFLLVGTAAGWWYRTTRPDYLFARGREALQREDWDRVDTCADRLEASGQTDRALFLRGSRLVRQGRQAEALRLLNRIRDKGDLRVEAASVSGRCLLELKALPEASRIFLWVLEQDEDNVDAHRGLAAIAYDLGNLTTALTHLEHVARLDDRDGRSYRLMAMIYGFMGQDDKAEEHYREALSRDLSHDFRRAVQLELAECLLRKTRYTEALELLDERLKSGETEELSSLAMRGDALRQQGKFTEAAAVLDRALVDYPRNPQLLNARGQLYLSRKEDARAIDMLEKAVAISPGDYSCRYSLARAYTAAGRKAEASEQEKKAAELRLVMDQLSSLSREAMRKPWDADIRYRLADICEKVDNRKLAAMWRQAARACQSRAGTSGEKGETRGE